MHSLAETADKRFVSFGQGFWPDVPANSWNDWKWQLKNRVTTLEQLESKVTLTREERAGVLLSGSKLALGITPHFFNLIDPHDPVCPIRRQVVPRIEETARSPLEMADPAKAFHTRWRGLLGLDMNPDAPKEHWTRVKALTRWSWTAPLRRLESPCSASVTPSTELKVPATP